MKAHEELDYVLNQLADKVKSTAIFDMNYLDKDYEQTFSILTPILERLVKDGNVAKEWNNGLPGQFSCFYYSLTFDGKYFLEEGGYKKRIRMEQINKLWTIVKTIATIIYSLAVLAVAVWAVWVEIYKP